jgi:hypothetical protein
MREEEFEPEVEDDRWAPFISEKRRRRRTASGLRPAGPWADSVAGLKGSLQPPPLFFVLFFVFHLFHNFCKKASKQFKPISKFFKNSKQCFKPVRKLVFK